MRKRMPKDDELLITYRILELCDNQYGASGKEIWEDEKLFRMRKKYTHWTFMDLVKSLKRVDLLQDKGKTKGNVYFTTERGHEALERYKAGEPVAGNPDYSLHSPPKPDDSPL